MLIFEFYSLILFPGMTTRRFHFSSIMKKRQVGCFMPFDYDLHL